MPDEKTFYVTGVLRKIAAKPRALMAWYEAWQIKHETYVFGELPVPADTSAIVEVPLGYLYDLRLAAVAGWKAVNVMSEMQPMQEPGDFIGGYPWEYEWDDFDDDLPEVIVA